MTKLSLHDYDKEPARGTSKGLVLLVVLLLLAVAGMGLYGYRVFQRMAVLEEQVATLTRESAEAAALARQAIERAAAAEAAAKAAAEAGRWRRPQTAGARRRPDAARQEATTARETAAKARGRGGRASARGREAEVDRLEAALGQIAETRRTALGLVMNLGSDHLKFEFNKADLQPEDRELLSRIAGILMTSHDYTISVNGHTDDVGLGRLQPEALRAPRPGGAGLPREGRAARRRS